MTNMRTSTKALTLLATAFVLVIGGKAIYAVLNPPDDKALIKAALNESIKATKEGRPGGVIDKLSMNLKYNGESEAGNQTEIARYIRNSRPDITVEKPEPVVVGDEARIVTPVDLNLDQLGMKMSKHLKDVTLVFHKEDARDWFIFPNQKWKLAEVDVPDSSVADLFQP